MHPRGVPNVLKRIFDISSGSKMQGSGGAAPATGELLIFEVILTEQYNVLTSCKVH